MSNTEITPPLHAGVQAEPARFELVRYDRACQALAEARSVDEVKEIRNAAVAMEAYARQAKNKDLEADAVEIRMRATRRLDQMRQAQKETVGLSTGTRVVGTSAGLPITRRDDRPTLASQGIDKNLAHQARVLGGMDDAAFEEKVIEARGSVSQVFRRTVRDIEMAAKRASNTPETPRAMLPSPTGRKIRVARNPGKRQWLLAIGPNISRADLLEKQMAAQADEFVVELQREHDQLLNEAAELEAEAARIRQQADIVRGQVTAAVKDKVGAVLPFTETYDFQCDETTDAGLAALPQEQLVARLLAARNVASGSITEKINRGYCGDMMLISSQQFEPGPGTWTRVGSPEWLDEMFPSWNDPPAEAARADIVEGGATEVEADEIAEAAE